MRNVIFISLLVAGLSGLTGCRANVAAVQPETSVQAATEKDPFLKQLAALPFDQRQNYVKAHKQEISRIMASPQLLVHLQRIMAGPAK